MTKMSTRLAERVTTTDTRPVKSFDSIMGKAEFAAYKSEWRAARRVRCLRAEKIEERHHRSIRTSIGIEIEDTSYQPYSKSGKETASRLVTVDAVAARLTLAQLIDQHPAILPSLRTEAPTIVIDVPEEWMDSASAIWREVLFEPSARLVDISAEAPLEYYDAAFLFVRTPPAAKNRPNDQKVALRALSLPLPVVAFSPMGMTHLPDAMLQAANWHLELPHLDPVTLSRCIRIITGKRCIEHISVELTTKLSVSDLMIGIRIDRTPAQCVAALKRLVTTRANKKKSRDIALEDLHGLEEARSWARATILDISAWKRGEINWDAVASTIALNGPPGTGKTLFARCFASDCGFPLITGSYAKWQASGDGHLGHFLRAMHADFETARKSQVPTVLFIDELDSFPDRNTIVHSHRDYTVKAVNGLLEQIDGLDGREGVILIAASNDLRRCDPALLRAGRFDKIANICLPSLEELERMFRVRLGENMLDEDIRTIVELAIGTTGADVELAVKNAKRVARGEARSVQLQDLRGAVSPEDDRPTELRWRASVHEASHILTDVIHFGPEDIFATIALQTSRAGASIRARRRRDAGTYADYRKRLEIILAGRAGEELLLGSPSDGAGGIPSSDLDVATRIAADMVASFGLTASTSLTYFGSMGSTQEFFNYSEIRGAVADELAGASKSCGVLLAKNLTALEFIAQRLLNTGRIDGSCVEQILENCRPNFGEVRGIKREVELHDASLNTETNL